jgi:hypothetical protein
MKLLGFSEAFGGDSCVCFSSTTGNGGDGGCMAGWLPHCPSLVFFYHSLSLSLSLSLFSFLPPFSSHAQVSVFFVLSFSLSNCVCAFLFRGMHTG